MTLTNLVFNRPVLNSHTSTRSSIGVWTRVDSHSRDSEAVQVAKDIAKIRSQPRSPVTSEATHPVHSPSRS